METVIMWTFGLIALPLIGAALLFIVYLATGLGGEQPAGSKGRPRS